PSELCSSISYVPLRDFHSFPTRRSSDLFDGRKYEELESAVGLFAQRLPIVLKIEPDRPVASLCGAAKDAVEQARNWQESFAWRLDRKSTRLNSSHVKISYAVFCLKKKKE